MNTTDIHTTARSWFLAKTVNGSVPKQVVGGSLDGLFYYEVLVGDDLYWLTDVGLFNPPSKGSSNAIVITDATSRPA